MWEYAIWLMNIGRVKRLTRDVWHVKISNYLRQTYPTIINSAVLAEKWRQCPVTGLWTEVTVHAASKQQPFTDRGDSRGTLTNSRHCLSISNRNVMRFFFSLQQFTATNLLQGGIWMIVKFDNQKKKQYFLYSWTHCGWIL